MKTLYGILLAMAFLLLNGCTGTAYEMDAKATAAAPWKVNEVIATTADDGDICLVNGNEVVCHYERRFLGVNPKGYYWVQEFYTPDTVRPYFKVSSSRLIIRSGAYLMNPQDAAVFGSLDNDDVASRKDINGKSIFYLTGRIQSFSMVKKGLKQGYWRNWYENGQIREEGNYKDGKKRGVWKKWNEKGELLEETSF